MANPVAEINSLGQSIWYDNMRRGLIASGALQRMVDAGEIQGITSNPTIFEKAIDGSADYDRAIRELAEQGASAEQILWDLAVNDIRSGADILLPVYHASGARDGYVSLEVSPELAADTEATVTSATDLHRRLDRPNVMIKVPATEQGLPAFTELIARGINVNVTLIFSVERYSEVARAYIQGLRRYLQSGGDVSRVASVASFFVSRVDTKVDELLQQLISSGEGRSEIATALLGKIGIANSKVAYQLFKQIFEGHEFADLKSAGAQVQRPLWASTSTKNPMYHDLMYIEELVGADTVNTVPPATLEALKDHGEIRSSLGENLDAALAQAKKYWTF